jgi:hypothetical protein
MTEGPSYPQGPALLYVHSPTDRDSISPPEVRTVTRVDWVVPVEGGPMSIADAHRERQVLRSLLEHALWLLDQED